MNLSGTFNFFRILYNPSIFIPQCTISTFDLLPIPLPEKTPGIPIKVVLLDKDNCFAKPHENQVWPLYEKTFSLLRKSYPGNQLLIVSNTAGSNDDPTGQHANLLEKSTGVNVFSHKIKKPGCWQEILDELKKKKLIESPDQIAVVGDRLFTDVAMANMIGASSVWIRDGVIPSNGLISRFEKMFYDMKGSGK